MEKNQILRRRVDAPTNVTNGDSAKVPDDFKESVISLMTKMENQIQESVISLMAKMENQINELTKTVQILVDHEKEKINQKLTQEEMKILGL